MKVAVLFDRFGPYHVARLAAASKFLTILPVELFGKSTEYQWEEVDGPEHRVTVFPNHAKADIPVPQLFCAVRQQLDRHLPDAVAINGWSDSGALSALYWCLKHKVPAIVMSDSTAVDEKRSVWKEAVKKRVVRLCSSGFVAGSRHIAYLKRLGMPPDFIFTGYDVVDNAYFQQAAGTVREYVPEVNERLGLPSRYFLVSSRFVAKKNLQFVLHAYAAYQKSPPQTKHDLVVLGDGPLKHELVALVRDLHLQHCVHFPGFVQYNKLPLYYAHASAFIHASTSEQWGLVVNEAMASGLPVIVSEQCGCVPELVLNGINGFTFNPYKQEELVSILQRISGHSYNLKWMGLKSREVIAQWSPDRFGKGLKKAAEAAKAAPRKSLSLVDALLLKSLIFR